jgi:Tfp pilus assembly protein PilN
MNWFQKNRDVKKKLLISIKLEEQVSVLSYCVLKKGEASGNQMMKEVEALKDIPEISKRIPIVLHFHGFGVLSRIVENAPNFQENLIVSGDKSDFLFCYKIFNQTIAVSFVRKTLLEETLTFLNERKAFLFELHLGPIPLTLLLNNYSSVSSDFILEKNSGEITRLERAAESSATYKRYLEAFSNFESFQEEEYQQALQTEALDGVKKEYKEYRRFVSLGIGILSFFLVALSVNYFYVNHLNQKAAEIEADLISYGDNFSLIDRLEQEKQRKLVLVGNSGIQAENHLSYYLDEIGGTVPTAIQFQSMEVFPLTDPLKPKRKVELNMAHIKIQGISSNSKVLDDWMESMEDLVWIGSVELMNYIRLDDNKSTFDILIKLKA